MAYTPTTDFMALLRQTSGGVRTERMPGLDYIVAALARTGLFQIFVSGVPPASNQATTLWFQPSTAGSYASEGEVWLWNTAVSAYQPATPALWAALLSASSSVAVQNVTTAGPVNVQPNTNIVLVQNVGAAVTLVLPLASVMENPVLIVDWANHAGANSILIEVSGGDTLPLGATTETIAADGASVFLRPIPGVGYAL